MVDITRSRSKIRNATGETMWSDIGTGIQAQAKIAFAGGVIGFFYAAYTRKPWFWFALGGMVAGSVVGYGIDKVNEKLN